MRTTRYADGGETQEKIDMLQKLIDNPSTPENDKKNFLDAQKKFKEKQALETKEMEKPKPKATAKPVARKPVARKPTTTAKPVARKPVARKPTATAKPVARKPIARKPVARKPVARKPMTVAKPKPTAKPVATKPVVKKPTIVKKPTATAKPTEKKLPKGVEMVSKKVVIVDGKKMNTDSKEFCDYLTSEFVKRKEQANSKKGTRKKTKSVMAQVSTKIEQGVEKAIKTGVAKQIPTLKKNPQVFIGKVEKLETATNNFLTKLKEVLGTEYDAKEVTDTTNAIHKLIEDLKKKYGKK